MSPVTLASGALAGVMPTAGTRPVSRSRSTCRLYPSNSTERDLRPCRISAVLDADPPVFGHPAAQRRRRAGQVHVLVADLPGGRHRRGRGLVAGLPGDERVHLVQQAQHLGQGLIPGGRVVPVRIQRRLQAGGGQLRHPGLRRHDGGPCGLPPPLQHRDHAQGLAQGVSHQVQGVLHPARAPQRGRSPAPPAAPARRIPRSARPAPPSARPAAGPGSSRSAACGTPPGSPWKTAAPPRPCSPGPAASAGPSPSPRSPHRR